MSFPLVFIDLAGPDEAALHRFYSTVFGWEADARGQFTVSGPGSIPFALREDPAEKRLYIGVPDVTAHLALIEQQGGVIDTPRFEVPGVAVIGLFRDPAGNPMGLVEMAGDEPRIP